MNIYNPTELQMLVEQHLRNETLSMKQSKRYPELFVLKYKRNVFYKNLWDDFLLECRGLVIDSDFNVVVHPLTKIFNYGENGYKPFDMDEPVLAFDKYNGFMLAVTNHEKYGLLFSTTGSLDSDFVDLGKRYFEEYYRGEIELNHTYIFEVCATEDPHIIQEKIGVYHIGTRNSEGRFIPEGEPALLRFCRLFEMSENIEGWVVYAKGNVVKVKTPAYLKKKLFCRANDDKLKTLLNQAKDGNIKQSEYYELFDEDFYGIVDFIVRNIDQFIGLNEHDRIKFLDENYFK